MLMCGWLGATAALVAQEPPVHYLHHGVMPPGAIGSQQLQRGGAMYGFYQPVEIKAPPGALVSLAVSDRFDEGVATPRKAGFLLAAVYRLRVTNIRLAEGAEVYPTIEIIDRLYAPPDQQARFAIPVELTETDLKLALAGKFVTRVVYLEDPQIALPTSLDPQSQNWFEVQPGQDPLAVADTLGRPVAILRIGGRLPDQIESPDPSFFFGSPPFVALPADRIAPSAEQPAARLQSNRTPDAALPTNPDVSTKPVLPAEVRAVAQRRNP